MNNESFANHPDAIRWNKRYSKSMSAPTACALLRDHLHLLPQTGTALDLASGLGGNALALAQQGLQTSAWDISPIALQKLGEKAAQLGLDIETQSVDLKKESIPYKAFDCIVVSYFLERRLCPSISQALKPGGVLFYQTFTLDKLSDTGPSKPSFLLKNNELISLFTDLEIRFYQEFQHCGDLNHGDRNTAQLIAQKPQQ